VGDFHRSRADRTRLGPETPESYYRDSYDYVTLRRVLIDPFRMAGSAGFQTAAFDEERDLAVESRWLTAGQDAVLVLDGEFLLRPALRDEWNASILIVNAAESPVYEADAQPWRYAGVLVDDSDPSHPVRVERLPD
jgi:uridine kinase